MRIGVDTNGRGSQAHKSIRKVGEITNPFHRGRWNRTFGPMSIFSEIEVDARVPARYRDARSGLLFRVVDETETEAPDRLVTTAIGDGLVAAITWGPVAVTDDVMKTWGVSVDEVMATAVANIASPPVERDTTDVEGATVDITVGHHWVSSLLVDRVKEGDTEEGFLAAIPRTDVLATTPVVGAETVDGLEALMAMCDEVYDPEDGGISPFVWWWYQDNYWRVTDRTEDGSIDFLFNSNVCAFHLYRAIEHLANPCAECGRA